MKRLFLVAILAVIWPSLTLAQNPPPPVPRPAPPPGAQLPGLPPPRDNTGKPQTGTARVRGRVVSTPAGVPLRRAQISLTSAEPGQPGQPLRRVTTTNAEGRFEFTDLPAGRFSVSATKAGYVTLQFGQRRPFETGTPVTVADDQTVERIDFGLPRGSVIIVRVTDEFGEPVTGVTVQVQRYQYGPDGQRRLTSVPGSSTPFATTDDQGQFRAFGLMPGEYVVQASMRTLGAAAGGGSESNEGFAPTFYPGTISADQAQTISLGIGEEQAVQFPMVASRMGRVTGTVVDSEGRPASGASLTLVTVTGTGMTSSGVGTVAADGSFTVNGIAPGEHSIRVNYRSGSTTSESASAPIVVGSNDVTGLQIALGTGTTISGRVAFEGTTPRNGGAAPLRVSVQQTDQARQFALLGGSTDPLANGTVDDEGNFKLAGASGRVFFNVGPTLGGWSIKAVTLDGEDITDVPLELAGRSTVADLRVTMTDKVTTVSGQVTNDRGQALSDYVVVIQGTEQKEPVVAARAIRVVRPDTSGRFETRGLRPGRHVATAIESIEQGRQFAPEFQQRLRQGAKEFSVREGETVTVDLRLTPEL